MTRALVLATLALLSGCSCVEYRVIDVDARAKLEDRRRFIVMTMTIDGETYADFPTAATALDLHYWRLPAAPPSRIVRPIEEAGETLHACLRAAREEMLALGYLPATEAEGPGAPDLVVVISVTWGHGGGVQLGNMRTYPFGPITRVAIDVGGPIDGEFERALVSIDAKPDDEDCELVAEDLVREMVGALPGPGDEKEAEKLEGKER